jgi:hypothetical protein
MASEADDLRGVPERFSGRRVAACIDRVSQPVELSSESLTIAAWRWTGVSITAAKAEPGRAGNQENRMTHSFVPPRRSYRAAIIACVCITLYTSCL